MAKKLTKSKQSYRVRNLYKGWCPNSGNKQWLERINAECISPEQFYNRYIKRRMPVVLTSSNTECLSGFSVRALEGIAGDCRVVVETADPESYQQFGRTDSTSRKHMKFSEFLNRMKEDELYCSTQPLPEDKHGPTRITSPHIQRFIDRGMLPDQLPLMGNMQLYQINSWIGCSEDGTSSGFHHDYHDNFYFLISGEKQFRIASPHFTSEQPTFGSKKNPNTLVHKNGLISYIGDSVREDGARRADVLRWKVRQDDANEESLKDQLEEQILDDMMNQENLATDTTPPSFCIESTAHGEYITETLRPGDMLYLPASFYHEVISFNNDQSDHHMAVNYWYYPPCSEGTFEHPYEDDFWKERWEGLAARESNRMSINRDRMRRNKLPLKFQYTDKEILRFIRKTEAKKRGSH